MARERVLPIRAEICLLGTREHANAACTYEASKVAVAVAQFECITEQTKMIGVRSELGLHLAGSERQAAHAYNH